MQDTRFNSRSPVVFAANATERIRARLLKFFAIGSGAKKTFSRTTSKPGKIHFAMRDHQFRVEINARPKTGTHRPGAAKRARSSK